MLLRPFRVHGRPTICVLSFDLQKIRSTDGWEELRQPSKLRISTPLSSLLGHQPLLLNEVGWANHIEKGEQGWLR